MVSENTADLHGAWQAALGRVPGFRLETKGRRVMTDQDALHNQVGAACRVSGFTISKLLRQFSAVAVSPSSIVAPISEPAIGSYLLICRSAASARFAICLSS